MPNPLVAANMNRGQQPPNRWNPEPEEYANSDTNKPYVGSIDHGVEVPEDIEYNPELDEDLYEDGDAVYDIEQDVTPIPVRIVTSETTSNEIKAFRVYRTYASIGSATPIVSRHDKRTSLKIKNLGTNRIWIGDTSGNAHALNGYPLDAGAELAITSILEVYAVAEDAATEPVPLAVFSDFSIEH